MTLVLGSLACVCVALRCVINATATKYRPAVRIISGVAALGWLSTAVQLGRML
jgi:hypothetical protein